MKLKEINKSFINGVFELIPQQFKDSRGVFTKLFHEDVFQTLGLNVKWSEQYYSTSKKHVIRGMHFQLPPHDHEKLVTCIDGEIVDVVVDLRKESITYGQFDQFELKSEIGNSIYIPRGCAHGFYTKSNQAIVLYNVSSVYNVDADYGIRWDSFGMEWPMDQPILSAKDRNLPPLQQFKTPF